MEWWDREMERNGQVLERIVALLIRFACLADRASLLPAPARLRLLAILGAGEAEAFDFVAGIAPDGPDDAAPSWVTEEPARLAASFRALAWVVMTLLAEARRLARTARSSPVHAGVRRTTMRSMVEGASGLA